MAISFAMGGTLLTWFYGNAAVREVAVGKSLTIFLTSVSVLHLALLKRGMRFSVLSFNDLAARVMSVIVSILCAWAGWRYWALVAGTVVLPLSVAVGAWWFCRQELLYVSSGAPQPG